MRSMDERMAAVAAGTLALKRRRERRGTAALALWSVCLFLTLEIGVGHLSGRCIGAFPGDLAASSLLEESAGGYVLAAVLSFAAGVGITVVCLRYRRKREEEDGEKAPRSSKEEAL